MHVDDYGEVAEQSRTQADTRLWSSFAAKKHKDRSHPSRILDSNSKSIFSQSAHSKMQNLQPVEPELIRDIPKLNIVPTVYLERNKSIL